MVTIKTQMCVNGVWAGTSETATMDDPTRDHTASFGDETDETYSELEAAWNERGDFRKVSTVVGGNTITLEEVK